MMTAAAARRLAWSTVFRLNGGFEVRGALPPGGCVVVANHGSHADAPSLIAALSARHRPAVAAAADYWFSSPGKAWFCRTFVAGFPVRRSGGGYADLAAHTTDLRAGRAVVVFPAGSRRSPDGRFHKGAFRLAQAAAVPVVPVMLDGSAGLIAASGLPRRGKVVVTIGEPLTVDDPAQSAVRVHDLLTQPVSLPQESIRVGLRERVAAFAGSRLALVLAAAWAFAEAISWPVITELLIAALVLSGPRHPVRRGVGLAVMAAVGSACGGVITMLLVRHGFVPPAPLTPPAMLVHARSALGRGTSGLWTQPLSGVPYKVYAHAAAQTPISVPSWFVASLEVRSVRMTAVALLAALVERFTRRWRHLYSAALAAGLLTFIIMLCVIVSAWSPER
jgi:1-acyl-sn-glycerol-3-phosphate acyltransferase/membrane protein YqaA with SNARE-associated domain